MPKKPQSDVAREKLVAVRLTAAEHITYTAAAEQDGIPLSPWLRWLAEQRVIAQSKRGK
jgi:hypothetical protein